MTYSERNKRLAIQLHIFLFPSLTQLIARVSFFYKKSKQRTARTENGGGADDLICCICPSLKKKHLTNSMVSLASSLPIIICILFQVFSITSLNALVDTRGRLCVIGTAYMYLLNTACAKTNIYIHYYHVAILRTPPNQRAPHTTRGAQRND